MSKYMKNFNGEKVFSLEYDKETLRDMVIELEKENCRLRNSDEILNNVIKGKDRDIERLNNIIENLEQENAVLKTQVVNKDKYSYGIR